MPPARGPKILYVVTEDWYFWSHRLALARAARDAGLEVVVATRVGRHGERLEAEGFRVVSIRMQRGEFRAWRELGALRELVGLYRRERPDIVHHVSLKPVLYGSMAARLTGVPLVVNAMTGLGSIFVGKSVRARRLRPVVSRALRWLLASRGTWVVVQNPDDRAAMLRLGVPEARLVLIRGSGVDTERFAPSPEPPGPPVVALVSRLLWDKGVGEFVEAARILKGGGAAFRAVLVGFADPDNPSAISGVQLQAWHDAGVVEWWGPTEDVVDVWRRAHIAVLPSYREGLPKSLIEAAACGRPLVATGVPGCREVVREGETGRLVPAGDAAALAGAIAGLLDDPETRRRFGAAARELAVREFSQARVVTEMLALYRGALGASWPAVRTPA